MKKIWLKQYLDGMSAEINPDQYPSLLELLEEKFTQFSDRIAYSCLGTDIDYKTVDEKSMQFAAWLQSKCSKGDRIAVMMPNLLQYPVVMFGILRAGMVVVNVNPLYTARELEHQLVDAKANTIIVLENFAHTVEEVLDKTEIQTIVISKIGDLLSFPFSIIDNFVVEHVKKLVPAFNLPEAIHLNDTISSAHEKDYVKPNLNGEDIAFLQYTGGTTGVAKGAILTHRNMIANILQALEFVNCCEKIAADERHVAITALPLYHIFSLLANCLTFTCVGAQNVLIPNPRDIKAFVKELSKYRFTFISGVNTLFNALLNAPDFEKLDFSKLALTLGGGMAVQSSTAKRWHELTDSVLLEAYGLTEASPAVCIDPTNLKEFNGSIGIPIPSTDISIRDSKDNELGIEEIGELWVRGPQVMRGYWNKPEETAKVLTKEGWLKTGDIAKVDAEGFVYIVDRKKDLILVSGFNVYPNEIEEVLTTHPEIIEAACIGVPSPKTGETVKAFVVLTKNSTLTETDIITFSAKSLTAYKIPTIVKIVDDLPKNNVGKILRRELRDK
jgi:long-chain acyl-CoA synthetase